MEHKNRTILLSLILIVLLALVSRSWAVEEVFPTKPIHIWVAWPAGGSTDTLTRYLSAIAEKILGQPIVVENKPGGTGGVGMGLLKNAKPDGYTLAASTDSAFTRLPHVTKVEYDPLKDFTYIISIGSPRIGTVVRSDSPFKQFQDLIEFARKNPGKLTHGIGGVGNATHLAYENIARMEKVKFQFIPFKGSAPNITALLGGHVMVATSVSTTWIPHVKAGALKPPLLMFLDPEGLPWPEVPTLKKLYGFEVLMSEMIVAPKGVPKPIIDKLEAAFAQATMTPQYQEMLPPMGISISKKPLVGDPLYQSVKETFDFTGPFIKEMGIQQ